MFSRKFPTEETEPRVLVFDNRCCLYQHLDKIGNPLYKRVSLLVDVFHWKCKHKKSNNACSIHCNPFNLLELLHSDSLSWYFNTSIASWPEKS